MQRQQEALSGSTGAHPDRVLTADVESAGRSMRMQCQQDALSGLIGTHPDCVLVLEMGGLPAEVGPPI